MEEQCSVCKIIPKVLGKKFFFHLFGHEYPKLFSKDVAKHLIGLNLKLVGGLSTRGWTVHDVDVTGEKKDAAVLEERLRKDNIPHPIHLCRQKPNHSHFLCALNGIKLVLTGRGY
ncbi:MAG: hypothetical protein HYT93_00700 [Parcubacteria group bacterium]|nr:hypothetical protein [Parcubacteria group bacterium]